MHALKNPSNLYLVAITFAGIGAFFLINDFLLDANSQMIIIFALVGAVVLLNIYRIPIPPDGNCISMDSAVYLASIYLFGLDLTLNVLFYYSVIFAIYQWKGTEWWKHLTNFSIYSIMIIISHYAFLFTGGETGIINITNLLPYIVSLTVYFILNTLLMLLYFLLAEREGLINLFKQLLRDKTFLVSYFNIFLLSFVLSILMENVGLFGLFLFVSISTLLSIAFIQHFDQYQAISLKANRDYLTGLNNHGYFKELLEEEVTAARETDSPLCLSIIDLDDFKKYNDLFGHLRGDQLLKELSSILETKASEKNYSVARYGGEEFAILMPNTKKNEALLFMNMVRKSVNDTYFDGAEALLYGCLSFSAGIAEFKKGTYNAEELLDKADQAMYYAKSQGKNLVEVYNDESDYHAEKSNSVEKQFVEAEQQLKLFLSKDVYTYRHSKRVFQYAVDFARKLGLTANERRILTLSALVHDIGKLEVPKDILNKKGKLDASEWEIVKKHVTWGKDIISTNKELVDLIPLVELHHERYDGKGYPYGMFGEDIPRLARILTIIDSFDAMTTERPYQKTKTFDEAFVELRECSGKQFDSYYIEPFIELIQQQYLERSGTE